MPRLKLLALFLVSIGLIHFADKIVFQFLSATTPSLSVLAAIRLPSLLICFFLYWFTGAEKSYQLPQSSKTWGASAKLALPWLLLTAYFVLVRKVWVPEIHGTVDITAFMVTGLLAEELLFRGAIYQLAKQAFPTASIKNIPAAVIISAAAFGLHHLSFHQFQITPAAVIQVTYTVVMGIFFGLIRERSQSIWPGTFTHFVNNCFTLLRNL